MASIPSVLKSILDIKNILIESCDEQIKSVRKFKEDREQKVIKIKARPHKKFQQLCPVCKTRCPIYDHKRETESEWRAPNLNGIPVYISYRPARIRCPKHGISTEYIPWSDGNSRFTPDFNNEIAWMVCQMSKTAIADYFGINWRTVGNCINAANKRLEPDKTERLHGLKNICVDETSYSKGHSYITVVYDMDRNRVVWVHPDHGKSIFQLFCESLTEEERAQIKVVAGDGAKWIDSCTSEYFPNATRCVDFFHVVQWANEAIDKVRINTAAKATREYNKCKSAFEKAEEDERKAAEQANVTAEAARTELEKMPRRGRPIKRKLELIAFLEEYDKTTNKTASASKSVGRPRKVTLSPEHQSILDEHAKAVNDIKRSKFALGHDPKKCTEDQTQKILLIEHSYPDLYKAYQLKEKLRLTLHMHDKEAASVELDSFIAESLTSDLAPMKALAEKIERHRTNILNSIECRANSSKSESTNTTIKVLIRMARGFKNLDNMIALIFLKCSDLVIPLNNRIQATSEQRAQMREIANQKRKLREEARCS